MSETGAKLRWGILGTGNIARQFSAGVNASRRGRLAAVGSRGEASARAFAAAYAVPAAYGRYEALLGDAGVDAVYNALPNALHHEWTIKALRAGKHVLCEKPLAVTAPQGEEMFDEARKAGRLLVEAFMYRTHPLTHAVLGAVRGGAIGELRLIRTSFCFRTNKIAGNVRFSRALAGGALMDVGCYCVGFSRLFAGEEPATVQAAGRLYPRGGDEGGVDEGGVDEMAAGTLLFPGGVVASFACGMRVQADNTAYLCGSEGFIEIPVPWKPPATGATYVIARGTPPRMDAGPPPAGAAAGPVSARDVRTVDAGMDLYGMEADAFARAALDGEPPAVTRGDTAGNLRVLDDLRQQVGVGF